MDLSNADRAMLARFKHMLEAHGLELCAVTLFGSRARGDADEDSDFDVLVVVERVTPAVRETVLSCAWEAGFPTSRIVAPVIVSRRELEATPFRSSLLMQAVRAEGQPL